MDLFDWETGGRDGGDGGPGGSCSWVTVVLIGAFVLLAVLVHSFLGFLGGLF